jgi:hypothetical protein
MTLQQLAPVARYLAWAVVAAGAVLGGASGLALALYFTRPKGTP